MMAIAGLLYAWPLLRSAGPGLGRSLAATENAFAALLALAVAASLVSLAVAGAVEKLVVLGAAQATVVATLFIVEPPPDRLPP